MPFCAVARLVGRLIPSPASVLVFVVTTPLLGATFTVDSLGDRTDAVLGDGFCATAPPVACTLRAAVVESNYLTGSDKVTLPAGRYRLSAPGEGESGGDLNISDDLTITGAGAGRTIIDADGIHRVFNVSLAASATFEDLTITGGEALPPNLSIRFQGGGVFAQEGTDVTLRRCHVTHNRAERGGGLRLLTGASLTLEDTLIAHNSIAEGGETAPNGGGVSLERLLQLSIERSTIVANSCAFGASSSPPDCFGGLYFSCDAASGRHDIINSTISGNDGPGIAAVQCDLDVNNTTINRNDDGLVYFGSSSSSLTISNSIVANSRDNDCTLISGVIAVQGGHNLDSDGSCGLSILTGDRPRVDPKLASLADSGGSTPTHVPLGGSPAIDAGANASCEPDDQDGYLRPDGFPKIAGTCDMGSVEILACSSGVFNLLLADDEPAPGTYQACSTITADPNVVLNGGDFAFLARDAVELGNGFLVTGSATLTAGIDRAAGAGL